VNGEEATTGGDADGGSGTEPIGVEPELEQLDDEAGEAERVEAENDIA
jgi:hypothetical protein